MNTEDYERKITHKIWQNESVKWEKCIRWYQQNQNTFLIAWFEETYEKMVGAFSAAGIPAAGVILTRQALHYPLENVPLLFIDHYPLKDKEEAFFYKHHLHRITVFSSLDEPLFKHFGKTKVLSTVKQSGTKDEVWDGEQAAVVIQEIQNKIAAQIAVELPATSQAEWLMKNLTA